MEQRLELPAVFRGGLFQRGHFLLQRLPLIGQAVQALAGFGFRLQPDRFRVLPGLAAERSTLRSRGIGRDQRMRVKLPMTGKGRSSPRMAVMMPQMG